MRDHLVRIVADRLDVPASYVAAAQAGGAAAPMPGSAGAAAMGPERSFLAQCLAGGAAGRGYLERLEDGHFSSDAARRARTHLLAHFDDPLADLPSDDGATAGLLTAVAAESAEQEAPSEIALEINFLQLEFRRVEREMKQAQHDGDLARQNVLAGTRQTVLQELDAAMGQTA